MSQIEQSIPGNTSGGVIRNLNLDVGRLPQRMFANELFECHLTGVAGDLYGELGPNLISCTLHHIAFPSGVSHFDAKDSVFLEAEFYGHFDRAFLTQSAFKDTLFSQATMQDTVFVDCTFESVQFDRCDFSVATFKSNVFRHCVFSDCVTNNKLFEHCIFWKCEFRQIRLQEGAILQNIGISIRHSKDLVVYRASTGETLGPGEIQPRNRLETLSCEYFLGNDLNESSVLLEVVQFRFDDATTRNVMHLATGIKQLSQFLLILVQAELLYPIFPLLLYWSIDSILTSRGVGNLPDSVLESLELAEVRLRVLYDALATQLPADETLLVLVDEEYSRANLQGLLDDLGLTIHIERFEVYNSPSIAELVSVDRMELVTFCILILATRFRLEIDRAQDKRRLLEFGTRLISGGKTHPAAAFQALLAINLPRLVYLRVSARLSLNLISRIRSLVMEIVSEPAMGRPRAPRDRE